MATADDTDTVTVLCTVDEDLPPLPTNTRTVRLLDHHGQLIEEIDPGLYEALRPAVNRTRAAMRRTTRAGSAPKKGK